MAMKWQSLALAGALAVLMAGCGRRESSSQTGSTTSDTSAMGTNRMADSAAMRMGDSGSTTSAGGRMRRADSMSHRRDSTKRAR